MATITIEQQRRWLKAVWEAMLGEGSLNYAPPGDISLHREIEIFLFDKADATSTDLIPDMLKRMSKAYRDAVIADLPQPAVHDLGEETIN